MKFFSTLILASFIILLFGCSKKENNLTAFNPEAFAFNIDNGWEVNATIRVKGFKQHEENKTYSAKLSYKANLLSIDGKTLITVNDILEEENTEELIDVPIEVQFELDSTFTVGKYKIEFRIEDAFSGQNTKAEKEFELAKE